MKIVKYYEEWLAGNHGAHEGYQKDNWLYCTTCGEKCCVGLPPSQVARALKRIKSR